MGKLKKFYFVIGIRSFVLISTLLLVSDFSAATPANSSSVCANAACAKQKAILRKLERTRPGKKVTRKQIFNRIKAACDKMRSLDCPDIRNYKPLICFTDF